MNGLIALLGGQEHTDGCQEIDRRLLAEARSAKPVVAVVLAATTPRRRAFKRREALAYWGLMGVEVRFALDGGPDEEQRSVEALADPDLVVMTGGHPWLLHARLDGSAVQQRIVELWHQGVPISGSSAGAIALCEWRQYLQPPHPLRLVRAFGLVPGSAAAPHYDRYQLSRWVTQVSRRYPTLQILGLTDRTALIGRDRDFRVFGQGGVTLVEGRRVVHVGRSASLQLAPATPIALRHDRPQPLTRGNRAVAPGLLGLVQRGVGGLDQSFGGGGVAWQSSDADACSDG